MVQTFVSPDELARWIGVEPEWLKNAAASAGLTRGHSEDLDPRRLQRWLSANGEPDLTGGEYELDRLRAIEAGLTTASSADAVAGQALAILETLAELDSACILLFDETGVLDVVGTAGHPGTAVEQDAKEIADWVLRNSEALVLPDPRRMGASPPGLDPHRPHDILAVPIHSEDKALGAIILWRRLASSPFVQGDLALTSMLAARIGVMIDLLNHSTRLSSERARTDSVQRQLEAYARDMRKTFSAEKRRSEELAAALEELERTYLATVRGMAIAVEAKDEYTAGHLLRVTHYGMMIMRSIAPERATEPQFEYGFLLHDIGKLGVPDAILKKNGPLTDEEWDLMREHPEMGRRILEGIPFLAEAKEIVYAHHERWDGKGYPRGLPGEDIPLGARIFPVADSFDAMTSNRPYRKALPLDVALSELRNGSGTQFWPDAVDAFLALPLEDLMSVVSVSTDLATLVDE